MASVLPVIGCIFIIVLCIVAYSPLRDRLALADMQSTIFGQIFYQTLPIFLSSFAFMFCVVLIYVGGKVEMGNK
jgi:hypothetical protein